MEKETQIKQEYITNEMINTYLKKYTFSDNGGVVFKSSKKYSIK